MQVARGMIMIRGKEYSSFGRKGDSSRVGSIASEGGEGGGKCFKWVSDNEKEEKKKI